MCGVCVLHSVIGMSTLPQLSLEALLSLVASTGPGEDLPMMLTFAVERSEPVSAASCYDFAWLVLEQLCTALSDVHGNKKVFGDLTPACVYVAEASSGVPQLTVEAPTDDADGTTSDDVAAAGRIVAQSLEAVSTAVARLQQHNAAKTPESQELGFVVARMTATDPVKRPTAKQLLGFESVSLRARLWRQRHQFASLADALESKWVERLQALERRESVTARREAAVDQFLHMYSLTRDQLDQVPRSDHQLQLFRDYYGLVTRDQPPQASVATAMPAQPFPASVAPTAAECASGDSAPPVPVPAHDASGASSIHGGSDSGDRTADTSVLRVSGAHATEASPTNDAGAYHSPPPMRPEFDDSVRVGSNHSSVAADDEPTAGFHHVPVATVLPTGTGDRAAPVDENVPIPSSGGAVPVATDVTVIDMDLTADSDDAAGGHAGTSADGAPEPRAIETSFELPRPTAVPRLPLGDPDDANAHNVTSASERSQWAEGHLSLLDQMQDALRSGGMGLAPPGSARRRAPMSGRQRDTDSPPPAPRPALTQASPEAWNANAVSAASSASARRGACPPVKPSPKTTRSSSQQRTPKRRGSPALAVTPPQRASSVGPRASRGRHAGPPPRRSVAKDGYVAAVPLRFESVEAANDAAAALHRR